MSEKIKLSQPILVGEDEVFGLELREPTGDDFIEIGDYYAVEVNEGRAPTIRFDNKAIMRYAARLAGVPPSSLKGLTRHDFQKIKEGVLNFLGEPEATGKDTPPSPKTTSTDALS